jgi:hypothetical protein
VKKKKIISKFHIFWNLLNIILEGGKSDEKQSLDCGISCSGALFCNGGELGGGICVWYLYRKTV